MVHTRNENMIGPVVVCVLIVYVFFVYTNQSSYISYYPALTFFHESNEKELNECHQRMSHRSPRDVDFFHLTNTSIADAFLPHVNEQKEELEQMMWRQNHIILFFKYLINRKRPWQFAQDKRTTPLDTSTAQTPAFPAGHAYQAYLLSKMLSKRYPHKKKLFMDLALRCDTCRVLAGIHFPSDGVFARQLVDYINPNL